MNGKSEHKMDFSGYFDGMSQLSANGAEHCEMLITAAEILDVMTEISTAISNEMVEFLAQ